MLFMSSTVGHRPAAGLALAAGILVVVSVQTDQREESRQGRTREDPPQTL